MSTEVVIIGAGPAGLGAALSLGRDATVLEAQNDVAGLSRTLNLDGAIFDLGGHSFHTPHAEIRDLVFGAVEMEEQRREAWVWMEGDWVRYPFQKHFHDLAALSIREFCEAGLAKRDVAKTAANFDEHISLQFGEGIAEHFMRPYNKKLWGDELRRMEVNWAAERIALPRGSIEAFKTAGGQRVALQADTKIAYPARGGFDEIFKALARRVASLQMGRTVISTEPRERRITTSAGEVLHWNKLISTLPLPRLLTLLPDVPAELTSAAARLEALAVTLVMIVFEGKISTARQRIYNPGADMLGHKIVFNNTSSHWLRAQPRHGIQVEISGAGELKDPVANIVAGLRRMNVIQASDTIISTKILRMPLGYPVPTHDRRDIVAKIKAWLQERHIFTVGRFGEWAYINADEALQRGVSLGAALGLDQVENA